MRRRRSVPGEDALPRLLVDVEAPDPVLERAPEKDSVAAREHVEPLRDDDVIHFRLRQQHDEKGPELASLDQRRGTIQPPRHEFLVRRRFRRIIRECPVKPDAYCRAEFAPITTQTVRVEATLRQGFSGGILEMKLE